MEVRNGKKSKIDDLGTNDDMYVEEAPNPNVSNEFKKLLEKLANQQHSAPISTAPVNHVQPMEHQPHHSNIVISKLHENNLASHVFQMNATNIPTLPPQTTEKKNKVDFHLLFQDIKQGKRLEEAYFVDVEGQPSNTVFQFTEKGLREYREGLQKLCRDNYRILRTYGVVPFGEHSQKQKVGYRKRYFQFVNTPVKKHRLEETSSSEMICSSTEASPPHSPPKDYEEKYHKEKIKRLNVQKVLDGVRELNAQQQREIEELKKEISRLREELMKKERDPQQN